MDRRPAKYTGAVHVELTTRAPDGEIAKFRGEAAVYEDALALAGAQIPEDHLRLNVRVYED